MVRNLRMRTIFCLILIPLYYIVGDKNIYLYVLSFALYKIFSACFYGVSIKETISNLNDNQKYKIFKLTTLIIGIVSLIFLLLGIVISDVIGNLLKINNTFVTFLLMGISIMADPITKIFLEYAESCNCKKIKVLYNSYCYLEMGLFLIIALIGFRGLSVNEEISNGLLYLAKIISAIIINGLIYFVVVGKKYSQMKQSKDKKKINYKKEIREIFNRNKLERVVIIIKEIYYYFSIVILYLMLSKRYSYMLKDVVEIISFLYLYGLSFINLLGNLLIKKYNYKIGILSKIYYIFDEFLSLAIIFGIMSPLICKVIFNNSEMATYLMMGSFLGIFITLYQMTFQYIGNYKLGYVSVMLGIVIKFILMIPLIDSFYRMGYNLVYGDIISTMIGMGISVIINYIYFKNREHENKYFEKILKSMSENIFLCILLVIMQFIIPIKTDSYLKALLLVFIYGYVSILFIKFKRKKRV